MKSALAPRRPRQERTTRQYLAMLRRMIRAAGRRVGEDADGSLKELLELHLVLDAATEDAMRGLRANGATWQEIGEWSGTTRQAQIMRWGPKL